MSTGFDSPSSYERDAFQSRRRLSSALDELTTNLTPGRVVDEILTFSKGGGASFLKGMGNSAASNPLPTLLIGAGLVMFLSGKGRIDAEGQGARSDPSGAGMSDKVASAFDSVTSGIRRVVQDIEAGVKTASNSTAAAARHVGSQAASAAGSMAEQAASVVEGAADIASSVKGQVSAGANTAKDAVNTGASSAIDVGSASIDSMSNRIATLLKEQPLLIAAAGLAIGTAFAALLPKSVAEDELFGETSDELKEVVGDAASEQYKQAADAVSKVVAEVQDSAAEEGISPSLAADTVRDLTGKVTRVVSAAGEATTEAVRGTLQKSDADHTVEEETTAS